ncbi:MAG: FAD-binding protein, partial [Nitrospirae bacterium]|nr:FAD-binding protein [Nitrospirota bacterium]
MKRFRFDVIVIGCGPAGATAAVTMARAGLSVLVLEAGVYAGAENWSGCVYFAENLARPEAFGEAAVLSAPYERRLVRRGIFLQNGLDLVGLSYQNPETFHHCYTVLRPIYDPYWAGLVQSSGAMVLPKTTVTSLIRRSGRVAGVETEHGPVYADVVFIAEGDASHLVRRERLERVMTPHFMQGVKAVFNLQPSVINERFHLSDGEGCAYEYLIRNGQTGGQTVHLNIGAFLYTNRDSLSFGYVVPLDNLKENYRGDHGKLLEWLRGLPHFRSLLDGAVLSAWGTKLIRSGGLKEQPVLVEDGLAVGGAATGLGIDLPYPNFTGPASASGLIFARAVCGLLKDGQPITADRLTQSYLEPLRASVYGRNADFLSSWPDYLEKSRTFFGRSADLACGLAHFLSRPKAPSWQTARFLRGHLTFKALREIFNDGGRMLRASGLSSGLSGGFTVLAPVSWIKNLFNRSSKTDPGFHITIQSSDGRTVGIRDFPWPIRGLLARLSPGLAEGMRAVYANDGKPLSGKFREAVRHILLRFKLTDWIILPLYGFYLLILSLASILLDLARYYILRQPVDKVLGGPVADYLQAQQAARDLDQARVIDSFEAKLATNSYRVGRRSHIRVIWPGELSGHGDLAQSPLWSVCPARVYQYDPPLIGRGVVTINHENCIKCETCWHAADDQARWGRQTDHRLIYRPASEASQILLDQKSPSTVPRPPREAGWTMPRPIQPAVLNVTDQETLQSFSESAQAVYRAVRALETAVENLPSSADATRREWPQKIGRMALRRLGHLHAKLSSEAIHGTFSVLGIPSEMQVEWQRTLEDDRKDLEHQISVGQEFHALSAARRIREEALNHIQDVLRPLSEDPAQSLSSVLPAVLEDRYRTPIHDQVTVLFPDRVVKDWEDLPIPPDAMERLRSFILDHSEQPLPLIRALSSVSPALGLLAARHIHAPEILKQANQPLRADLCVVDAQSFLSDRPALSIRAVDGGWIIDGILELVPLALSSGLLLVYQNQARPVMLNQAGLKTIPTPAIGFRAAGLHRVEFNAVKVTTPGFPDPGHLPSGEAYAAIALGAGDYLSRRAKEHAEGRVQFAHQMRDTQGRDGIAKLGAVKSMIARIEAWHLLLSVLLDEKPGPASPERSDLCAAVAAMAFGPEAGQMGYDAGQVFGGFAYSEDDLLSRAYRDSALFRYLPPGFGAAERLVGRLHENGAVFEPPDASTRPMIQEIQNGPLAGTAAQWKENVARWKELFSATDPHKAGDAAALLLGTGRV